MLHVLLTNKLKNTMEILGKKMSLESVMNWAMAFILVEILNSFISIFIPHLQLTYVWGGVCLWLLTDGLSVATDLKAAEQRIDDLHCKLCAYEYLSELLSTLNRKVDHYHKKTIEGMVGLILADQLERRHAMVDRSNSNGSVSEANAQPQLPNNNDVQTEVIHNSDATRRIKSMQNLMQYACHPLIGDKTKKERGDSKKKKKLQSERCSL